ncbi:MAG: hypothetical protein DI585_06350 [Pseudomonas fluorescens]|nr:MAG: hypothetical protein DI585_06350 [Pseudomonas fluorescens]
MNTPPPFPASSPTVLVADDDRVIRNLLSGMLEDSGYTVLEAADGQEAYSILNQRPGSIDAALIDRNMPGLDGLSLVRMMKQNADLAQMPVVMVTGAAEPNQVREGLNAGVFYYLTKPVEKAVVGAVVNSAVTEGTRRRNFTRQLRGHSGLAMLRQGVFTCRTVAEAEQLATQLAPLFPQPGRALGGIAALILNAVEHGLLGIGYTLKGQLLAQGNWAQEVARRESLPENREKLIKVVIERQPDSTRLTIADPGNGFDWRSYLEFSPERATAGHGRGIAQARASGFDKLAYNPAGNIVQAQAGIRPDLSW